MKFLLSPLRYLIGRVDCCNKVLKPFFLSAENYVLTPVIFGDIQLQNSNIATTLTMPFLFFIWRSANLAQKFWTV